MMLISVSMAAMKKTRKPPPKPPRAPTTIASKNKVY